MNSHLPTKLFAGYLRAQRAPGSDGRAGARLGSPIGLSPAALALGAAASLEARRRAAADWLAAVRAIVARQYAETESYLGTAKRLNTQGVPARRGGAWSATQVRRVLAANSAQECTQRKTIGEVLPENE